MRSLRRSIIQIGSERTPTKEEWARLYKIAATQADNQKHLDCPEVQRVLAAIRDCGKVGMTDYECQRALRMGPQTQTPARLCLQSLGLVKDSGAKRKARKYSAIVWRAT